MHFLVYIYNYHGGGFRARERASEAAGYAFATSTATSCFLSLLFLFFSRVCERSRDSTRDWQTFGGFTDAPCVHPQARRRSNVWKKLLRMISMRPRFSGKSLKYLRIYSTFHEYPRRGAKAALLCVAESPSTWFNGDRYESHDLNFLRNKRNKNYIKLYFYNSDITDESVI